MTTKTEALRIAEKWASAAQRSIDAIVTMSPGREIPDISCHVKSSIVHIALISDDPAGLYGDILLLWHHNQGIGGLLMDLAEFKTRVVRWLHSLGATFDPDQFSALLDLELLTD